MRYSQSFAILNTSWCSTIHGPQNAHNHLAKHDNRISKVPGNCSSVYVFFALNSAKQKHHGLEEVGCEAQVCSILLLLLECTIHHWRSFLEQSRFTAPSLPNSINSWWGWWIEIKATKTTRFGEGMKEFRSNLLLMNSWGFERIWRISWSDLGKSEFC